MVPSPYSQKVTNNGQVIPGDSKAVLISSRRKRITFASQAGIHRGSPATRDKTSERYGEHGAKEAPYTCHSYAAESTAPKKRRIPVIPMFWRAWHQRSAVYLSFLCS